MTKGICIPRDHTIIRRRIALVELSRRIDLHLHFINSETNREYSNKWPFENKFLLNVKNYIFFFYNVNINFGSYYIALLI